MGCVQSSGIDDEAKARNDEIENQLKRDRMMAKNEIKMLLLGAGESGKSTVLKQMKLIHHGGYNEQERDSYKEIIFSNTIQSMRAILEAMPSLDIQLSPQNDARRSIILSLPGQLECDMLPHDVADAVRGLWKDPGVKEAVRRSREFQLNDSAVYYFNAIDRMSSSVYLPTDQDILRSRVKTTGITETTFKVGELTYKLFDVGGQRSERKKWIHCFENVTALVFLVSLSEYDQMLYEDESVNRMQEALTLFDSICNSRWFVKTSIILFLNKIDLFAEKLPRSPLGDYFPDYTGGDDYDAACNYLLHRFVSLNQSAATKQIYAHYTCATDTQQIKFVLTVRSVLHHCTYLESRFSTANQSPRVTLFMPPCDFSDTYKIEPTISVEEWEAKSPLGDLEARSINAIKVASERTALPLKFSVEDPSSSSQSSTPVLRNKLAPASRPSTPSLSSATRTPATHALHPKHPIQTPQQFYDWFALIDRSVAHSQEAHFRAHLESVSEHLETCDRLVQRIDEVDSEVEGMLQGWRSVEEGGKVSKMRASNCLRNGLLGITESIGERLEYFQELEHATRMLNILASLRSADGLPVYGRTCGHLHRLPQGASAFPRSRNLPSALSTMHDTGYDPNQDADVREGRILYGADASALHTVQLRIYAVITALG
ncbi:Guanine nucleotide-binding protein subunit alpha [Grifola frondosa]|uniref:Guanine nucleotide-binding protein subunit alpha n=1 Tax=Grifola frondosa TaxID=5627 RepID=A0A1C7M3I9_GRIFR|nr:Guanine nucleotide-binding protein subunit alpha [Grifola frondosa]